MPFNPDRLPPPDRCVEVESGGAPTLRPGEHQLGGAAVAEPGDDAGLDPWEDVGEAGVTASLDTPEYPGEGYERGDEAAGPGAA
jgi:hypothetical protein